MILGLAPQALCWRPLCGLNDVWRSAGSDQNLTPGSFL